MCREQIISMFVEGFRNHSRKSSVPNNEHVSFKMSKPVSWFHDIGL